MFGIGIAASTTADAQWRDNTYRRQQREYEREQRRRQREYERQQRRAQRQAQRGVYNNGVYNNGGYGVYSRRTRDGYGNYGGTFDLRQTALNAGYNEGMKEGREDRSRNERFNFSDESDYRSATKDYSSRLGDRSTYQTYFRQAFQNGYRDGYYGNTGSGYYDPYNY
ncbi:MAG TPA: hypothetical protein VN228_22300 [Pyrinomonadaceae bacterium]|nr:hypothetical protein [Pyrinomonadaceae bacterium]